ncbi:IS110 family transposase [Actinomyces oris]|uniref:IS110 family transposase n=1 Tax=Actinomyces oris TaxID=544580 RepID=UPI00094CB6C5|nr:IS110 family transposase [Actinomyces oris]OLO76274.1 IS110 family transposase [Actinomyces oris]
MDIEDIAVFIGIDVGKSEHWATALSRDGQKVLDRALPNDEERLRAVYKKLADHGSLLVVVDQPATIGALAVAVAQDMGITVGYLPGLSMRRIADLTPGSAKTDAKDAAVIAGAARTMPHTLRAVTTSDEEAAALSMLTGFDLDLARQVNQSANRIRGLYTQIHPALEAVVGPWLEHDAVLEVILEVIAAWPTPADLKRAGKARIDARLKKHGCRRHATWAGQIVSALEHQTVVVAGTDAAATVLPHLASQLISLHAQRADVAAQVEALVQAHPLYQVLTSMPGIGVRTAAVFLAETLGKTFDTGAQLASYAGLAPDTRRSGSSIRGEHVSHGGNKRLKRAMFLSAFASLRSDPVSRAYYQRKRDQGKRHNQAVLALAHRRILTLHAMIRDGALYDPQPATKLPAAA